jgi:xanthine dehydrogenase accessory factor
MSTGPRILIRGGGDLATGVAARLYRAGFHVLVTELEQPLALRRLVALAQAVYDGAVEIEDLHGRRVESEADAASCWGSGRIPVLVDPQAEVRGALAPAALVDARMRKQPPDLGRGAAPTVIGLGPGFVAGENCDAVIETNRGHHMGRVFWQGRAKRDTGMPEPVHGFDVDRVLRSPADGILEGKVPLGSVVEAGDTLAVVNGAPLKAPFRGALRGLVHAGLPVRSGMKVGDLDPRAEPSYCSQISDKALAVGGGALEALLSQTAIRRQLAS